MKIQEMRYRDAMPLTRYCSYQVCSLEDVQLNGIRLLTVADSWISPT